MNLCPTCTTELMPGAKFCHRCGEKIMLKSKLCPECHESNPLASVFCHHCGFHFEGKKGKTASAGYLPVFPLDFDPDSLQEQVKNLFFKNLRRRVEEEHDINMYSEFVERFYDSRFREIYTVRSGQIAEEVMLQWERFGREALPEIDRRIGDAFEGLLDFFIIQYCPDLTGFVLPETILKHDRILPGRTDLHVLIRDFLDFNREQEVFYFDFITMPQEFLGNACKSFLHAERKEKVLFICDLSLKGNCKDGFAMTDRGIYWRAPFNKAHRVLYQELKEIKKEKDWLTINGHFFTANPTLNLKLCKLLKKLRGWQAPLAA